MAAPNWKNRTLFESDNLPILLGMDSETVDLIATDPPFKKDKKFQGIGAAEGQKMDDTWVWHGAPPGSPGEGRKSDIHKEWLDHTRENWPALYEVIEMVYSAHSPSMAAFLAFMSVRLIEMHRILKPTGTLYLHCDPTANSYLRMVLNSIFGTGEQGDPGFRNEIVWGYSGGGVPRRDYPRKHDTILRYTKGASWTFNVSRKPYAENTQQVGKHSTYTGGDDIDLERGTPITDVWVDVKTVTGWNPERTGWATQKPLALYRRIIEASSNEGDVVLDPFCGCATTCVAAEQLGRQWVGIDQSPKAKGIVKDRLEREVRKSLEWEKTVTVANRPPARTDAGGLLSPTLSLPPRSETQKRGGKGGRTIAPSYDRNEIRVTLAMRDGALCQGCGYEPPTPPGSLNPELEYLDIDHIKPRADKGSDDVRNLCLLCPPCNRRKAHIWTLAQLRESNQRHKKMVNARRLKRKLAE